MQADDLDQGQPGWLTTHLDAWLTFMDGHKPNPFDQPADTTPFLGLHQNDYLRLSKHPEVLLSKEIANRRVGTGSVASLVFGADSGEHGKLGGKLRESLKTGDVILTTSGWCANVGLLEAVAPADIPIYIDKEAHASLWAGAQLSKGKAIIVKHNDVEYLEKRIKRDGKGIVCIDAFYSTDGAVSDLKAYVELCEKYNCFLVLDEAHSFGMIGPKGGGLAVGLGLEDRIAFRTVSLSKAIGGNGGFIAGSEKAIRFLRYRCHSIVFSSSPSETNSAGHEAALSILVREPERAQRCLSMASLFRNKLQAHGIPTGQSQCQIVSIIFNGPYTTSRLYKGMRSEGILFSAFAPPATPAHQSFARFSIHSDITENDLSRAADVAAKCIRELELERYLVTEKRPGNTIPELGEHGQG